jgi:hypothetical protein
MDKHRNVSLRVYRDRSASHYLRSFHSFKSRHFCFCWSFRHGHLGVVVVVFVGLCHYCYHRGISWLARLVLAYFVSAVATGLSETFDRRPQRDNFKPTICLRSRRVIFVFGALLLWSRVLRSSMIPFRFELSFYHFSYHISSFAFLRPLVFGVFCLAPLPVTLRLGLCRFLLPSGIVVVLSHNLALL